MGASYSCGSEFHSRFDSCGSEFHSRFCDLSCGSEFHSRCFPQGIGRTNLPHTRHWPLTGLPVGASCTRDSVIYPVGASSTRDTSHTEIGRTNLPPTQRKSGEQISLLQGESGEQISLPQGNRENESPSYRGNRENNLPPTGGIGRTISIPHRAISPHTGESPSHTRDLVMIL